MVDPLPILPFTKPAAASVRLPGSKSITNRALILAALGEGETLLEGALFSEDTKIMATALQSLGFFVEADPAAETIRIRGEGGKIPNRSAKIHVGNAGTAARFLTAFCCLATDGDFQLDGVPQMRKRPMKGLIDALAGLGARIESDDGFFPIRIRGGGLSGGEIRVDATESSQMLSALLMVAPAAKSECVFLVPEFRAPFVLMTLQMMEQFGQSLSSVNPETFAQGVSGKPVLHPGAEIIRVPSGQSYRAPGNGVYRVEADMSAASYFLALPFVTGGKLTLENLPSATESLQGDAAFIAVLEKIGVRVSASPTGGIISEFVGPKPDSPLNLDFNAFSDTFLTLAAVSPLLPKPVAIRGIRHTRKQETDRVSAMTAELRKLGQNVVEEEDSLAISPVPLVPKIDAIYEIETYRDHRFAMSFGILGSLDLRGDGKPWLAIRDPGCCAKTFPEFFRALESVRQRSHLIHRPNADPFSMSESDFVIISIDGGAATGKSSTARALSRRFNLLHVDTGAFYRTIALSLLNAGVSPDDPEAVKTALPRLGISTGVINGQALMLIDGEIPGDAIRTLAVNESVSRFAAQPAVRDYLLSYQRNQVQVAKENNFPGLVMEGRDIGSVIFPEADFQFFLLADEEERMRRRAVQGQQDEIRKRDEMDSQRKTAPLVCPPRALSINSTRLSLEQVVAEMSRHIETRLRPADQ